MTAQVKPMPERTRAIAALNVLGSKWTLPIIEVLQDGPVRRVDIWRRLRDNTGGISTEQLTIRLRGMVADELIERERIAEVPPRVMYGLTEREARAVRVIAALDEWATTGALQ